MVRIGYVAILPKSASDLLAFCFLARCRFRQYAVKNRLRMSSLKYSGVEEVAPLAIRLVDAV
jgi:hypothetical protein